MLTYLTILDYCLNGFFIKGIKLRVRLQVTNTGYGRTVRKSGKPKPYLIRFDWLGRLYVGTTLFYRWKNKRVTLKTG